ncbi:MAG TPA: hypothetical protein VN703_09655 [Candidatus Sulfopaludibacter sp.]|nr:hypothetical protein [Candidatus Sulfopaludibacter sp.]
MIKFSLLSLFYRETNISELIVDKTKLKVGSKLKWLRFAIESISKEIVPTNISKERNMFIVHVFYLMLCFVA